MLAVRVIHVPLICIKRLHCWLDIEEGPGMTAGTFTCCRLRGFTCLYTNIRKVVFFKDSKDSYPCRNSNLNLILLSTENRET